VKFIVPNNNYNSNNHKRDVRAQTKINRYINKTQINGSYCIEGGDGDRIWPLYLHIIFICIKYRHLTSDDIIYRRCMFGLDIPRQTYDTRLIFIFILIKLI